MRDCGVHAAFSRHPAQQVRGCVREGALSMRSSGLRPSGVFDAYIIGQPGVRAACLSLFSFSTGYIFLTGLLTLPSGPYTCDIAQAHAATGLSTCYACTTILAEAIEEDIGSAEKEGKGEQLSIQIRKSHDTCTSSAPESYSQNRRSIFGDSSKHSSRTSYRCESEY